MEFLREPVPPPEHHSQRSQSNTKKKNRPPVESRSPSPSLLEPSNNLEGEDVGGDVGEDGSAAANELEQSNEVQSSSPESKKPKICLYVKFKKAANSGEAPGKF